MAMNISPSGVEITNRFFKAIEILVENGYMRGLQTFTRRYNLNRRNIQHIKGSPSNTVLKPELLANLVTDFNISAYWLLTGNGPVFQDGTDGNPNANKGRKPPKNKREMEDSDERN